MVVALSTLNVTQSSIRDFKQVHRLMHYANENQTFDENFLKEFLPNEKHSLILISRFPDGQCYIHDGHHRVFALYLAQRTFLYPAEYSFLDFDSYDKYNEINFQATWVTPLNIQEELRVPNVRDFKNYVLSLPQEEAQDYILSHHDSYAIPRNNVKTLEDFSRKVLLQGEDKLQELIQLIYL